MDSFCIRMTYQFTTDDMKGIFSDVGTVSEVTIYEEEGGYSYDIHMSVWKSERFRNELLKGKCRYCWEYGRHPSYFICERPNVFIKN